MFDSQQADDWHGQDVVDLDGHHVGRIEEVYRDNYGPTAGFACVKTGLFGRRLTFVPLDGATIEHDQIRVCYPADQIKHAPSVEPDGVLTPQEETALFDHYGLDSAIEPEPELSPAPPPLDPQAQFSPAPSRLRRHYGPAEAANVASARQLAEQDELRGGGYPGATAGGFATDSDRLAALEERVARLELEQRHGS